MELIILIALVAGGLYLYDKKRITMQEFLQKNSYEAYLERNGQTRIQCFKCGSKQIGVQNGRNNSGIRTHFCRSCGRNLFYSEETR